MTHFSERIPVVNRRMTVVHVAAKKWEACSVHCYFNAQVICCWDGNMSQSDDLYEDRSWMKDIRDDFHCDAATYVIIKSIVPLGT
jgi:hypothetical protein